jgi:DNA-binding transcriptional ArsR family regulator
MKLGCSLFRLVSGVDYMDVLRAVGDETRLRILRLLFSEPLNVNQVAERLKISQPNVSKHLRVLRKAGLLERKVQGKQRIYRVGTVHKANTGDDQVLDLVFFTVYFNKMSP